MKVCRFDRDRIGIVQGSALFDVTDALGKARIDECMGNRMAILQSTIALTKTQVRSSPRHDLSSMVMSVPVARPGKIIAAPLNYAAHVREMREAGLLAPHGSGDIATAGLFLKASSSLAGPDDGILLRFPERRTDHEVELVAVIGSHASNVPVDRALSHVAGYCIGIDVTLRGPEDRSFRKSIDTYSVLGPWLATSDEITDPQNLRLRLKCNGEIRQDSSTSDMVMTVAELIAFASRFYTLEPGDVLFTGSPQGVGPIHAGDLLTVDCEGLGEMSVSVRASAPVQTFLKESSDA